METLTQRANFVVLCLSLTAGCMDDGSASFGDDLTDHQLPARGAKDMPLWLSAGFYRAWRCEPAPHAGRPPSPHGTTRICNNDALVAAGSGPFPVGTATVKEIFDAGGISGYAVSRKLTAGTAGDAWYWYEGSGGNVYANAEGVGGCTGCHAGAARDFVFTVVP